MSINLFGLAKAKINDSDWHGKIYLESGPTIEDVTEIGVAKGQPTIGYAKLDEDSNGNFHYFYFQIKDLIGFLVEEDAGELDEAEKDSD